MDIKHEDVSVVSKGFKRKLSKVNSKISSMTPKKVMIINLNSLKLYYLYRWVVLRENLKS